MELTIKYKDGTEEQVELEDTPLKEGEQIFKVGNKWYLKKMEYKNVRSIYKYIPILCISNRPWSKAFIM